MKIGIIGGSGLDNPDILKNAKDIDVDTRYGKPSSPLKIGEIEGIEVAILSRHGRQHTIPPTQINNRANIIALKEYGCTHIIATTAVGSLREPIGRGDIVIPDQFIDFTRHRIITFFDDFAPGEMHHTPMAEPFDSFLRKKIIEQARTMKVRLHERGTVITIEGPRFSTKAESNMFRMWGADIINMTTAPECILANEASIPYAAIAMSTDYDCWKEDEEPVTWQAVLDIFNKNVGNVTTLIVRVIAAVAENKAI